MLPRSSRAWSPSQRIRRGSAAGEDARVGTREQKCPSWVLSFVWNVEEIENGPPRSRSCDPSGGKDCHRWPCLELRPLRDTLEGGASIWPPADHLCYNPRRESVDSELLVPAPGRSGAGMLTMVGASAEG